MTTTQLNPETTLGYLKFEGESVGEGIIDARAGAKALEGLDSAVRFFLLQERPNLADVDIPIPVRIEKGSWIAEIPNHAGALILTGFGLIVASYLKKAAEKMAERDFTDVGLRDILIQSLKCVRWLIAVSKHLGHTNLRGASVVWDRPDQVGFVNGRLEVIYLPASFLKPLAAAPSRLLSKVASVVETERTLALGVNEEGRFVEEKITRQEKEIFSEEEADTDVLLPELVHGQNVELEGVVTRGNGRANTMGFFYMGHVLTCYPRHGSIVTYKDQLFLTCKLTGEITRFDRNGNPSDPRPKIIIDSLDALSANQQIDLPMPDGNEADEP